MARANENFFASAGTSALLHGATNSTSGVTKLSIKVDEAFAFDIMYQCGAAINRFLKTLSGSVKFKVNFLPVSIFNETEMIDQYKGAMNFGIGKLQYAACIGIQQTDLLGQTFIEREILDFDRDNFLGYYNALVKFAKNNLSYYKSLLDETNAKDEHLLWSLLCLTMNQVENNFSKEFTLRKDGFNWDLMLLETVDKLYKDEFFISANGNFWDYYDRRIGILAFPSSHWKDDGGASDVIAYNRALNGQFDLDLLNNIFNLNKKYNDMLESEKEIINKYIQRGYLELEDNVIKINKIFNEINNKNKS